MKKDIFLLDMDDTLLDFARAEEAGVLKTLETMKLPSTREAARRFHVINDGLWKALEKGLIKREEITYKRYELLFEEYGFQGDYRVAAELYFENLASFCFPFEGMEEFLKELKARGRIYIVTNGSAYIQHRHLEEGGIAPYADGVFISDEVGFPKPSAAYCAYVREHIPGYDGARAAYLGDSLTADMPCAQGLGATFVRYLPRDTQGEGIRRFEEFLQICENPLQ